MLQVSDGAFSESCLECTGSDACFYDLLLWQKTNPYQQNNYKDYFIILFGLKNVLHNLSDL